MIRWRPLGAATAFVLACAGAVSAAAATIYPIEVEALSDGRLVVLDRRRGPVLVDPARRSARFLLPHLSGYEPRGLAVARMPGGHRLYLAASRRGSDGSHHRIIAYDERGKRLQEWRFFSTLSLAGLAADPDGERLLFVDPLSANLYALDLRRRGATPDLVSRVFGAARLSGVAPGRGEVFVADPGRGRVFSIGADGAVRQFAENLGMPVSIQWVSRGDSLLVLDALGGRVLELSGGRTKVMGTLPDWDLPSGLALTPDGTAVWVVDLHRRVLTRIPRTGAPKEIALDDLRSD